MFPFCSMFHFMLIYPILHLFMFPVICRLVDRQQTTAWQHLMLCQSSQLQSEADQSLKLFQQYCELTICHNCSLLWSFISFSSLFQKHLFLKCWETILSMSTRRLQFLLHLSYVSYLLAVLSMISLFSTLNNDGSQRFPFCGK